MTAFTFDNIVYLFFKSKGFPGDSRWSEDQRNREYCLFDTANDPVKSASLSYDKPTTLPLYKDIFGFRLLKAEQSHLNSYNILCKSYKGKDMYGHLVTTLIIWRDGNYWKEC